jgi:hypothetical protein
MQCPVCKRPLRPLIARALVRAISGVPGFPKETPSTSKVESQADDYRWVVDHLSYGVSL